MVLTQIPHSDAAHILPKHKRHLTCMQNFVGMIEYLMSWKWTGSDRVSAAGGMLFSLKALPFRVTDTGEIDVLVPRSTDDCTVFPSDRLAFEWLFHFAVRDLQYRGFRDERLASFRQKQEANFLLYRRVERCTDDHEYEMLRQSWDTLNRPKYANRVWSEKQQEAIDAVLNAVRQSDENLKQSMDPFLFIKGPPGSGKCCID